jgi:hypothetical protein
VGRVVQQTAYYSNDNSTDATERALPVTISMGQPRTVLVKTTSRVSYFLNYLRSHASCSLVRQNC